MADLIKKVKIKKQDETYTDYIPIGAEAKNVDCSDGESVEYKLNKKPYYYNNVADMKADVKLKTGDMVVTLGYYNIDDGGRAEYKIINTESQNDFQEVLNNGLYANLIIKNDTVSFKQIGAIADGTTDNTAIINKALDIIKRKHISNFYINEGTFVMNNSQFVIPNGLHLYGSGNKSIIEVDDFPATTFDKVFITNNFNDDDIDTFIIEKFKILNKSTNGIRSMRFRKTNGIIIRDMQFVNDADGRFSAVDLYSENTNALIEKCYILSTSIVTGKISGAFSIREYNPNGITENITIRSCYCEKTGVDESLWIDSWLGKVRNVLVDNFSMKDMSRTESADCIAIVCNRNNSKCENITLQNCYFYKVGLHNRMMNIAHSQLDGHIGHVDNVLIDNCVFETDEIVTGGTTHFIDIGEFLENKGATVKNCEFINNDVNNPISYFILGSKIENPLFYSENNEFYGLCDIGIRHILSSKNDHFNKAPITTVYKYCSNIDNFQCEEKIPYLNMVQAESKATIITISNLKNLKCNRVINNSNAIVIEYKLINCEIQNDSYVILNSQSSPDISLEFLNCDIKYPQITTNNHINLKTSGLSVEGKIFKGIPTNQYDRNNYPVGTIFFSNTPTKAIVRKISEGDATSNWEEI